MTEEDLKRLANLVREAGSLQALNECIRERVPVFDDVFQDTLLEVLTRKQAKYLADLLRSHL